MVAGRSYWIAIWYGILTLGMLGLWSSVYWGRQTHWKNVDELLRALGTISVSIGMLLLLNGRATFFGRLLLLVALICFIAAFVLGRKSRAAPADPSADDFGDDEPGTGA